MTAGFFSVLYLSMIAQLMLSHPLEEKITENGPDLNIQGNENKNSTTEYCGGSVLSGNEMFLTSQNENETFHVSAANKIPKQFQYSTICDKLPIVENGSIQTVENGSIGTIENRSIEAVKNVSNGKVEKLPPFSKSNCKFHYYTSENFSFLLNGSVVWSGKVLEEGTYEIEGNKLKICENAYFVPESLLKSILLMMEKVACGISIIALLLHLLVFVCVPSMRNLPGYNLISLSVAVLMANSFYLSGEVLIKLNTSCTASSSLEHFFFLSAFFWMNVIAFDIWSTLRLAIQKLIAPDSKINVPKFLCYCVYAWGVPLGFAVTAAVMDSSPEIADEHKPLFGRNAYCWFNNKKAMRIYFSIPIFVLLASNVIFFVMGAVMIMRNAMKDSIEKRDAKRNFFVYVRIELIIGVTWLIAVLVSGVEREGIWEDIWVVLDVLNSLKGLLIFLLFSCSKKNWNHLKRKAKNIPEQSSRSTTIENCSTRM